MIMTRLSLILGTLVLWVVPVQAADLTKIDRSIAKEPAYTSKPKYCLLVFGPEAKMRVWLVLDGEALYADRNGNGDLTEDGERFVPAKDEYVPIPGRRVWRVGDIAAPGGKVVYTGLQMTDVYANIGKFECHGLGITVKIPLGSTRSFQSAGSLVTPTHGHSLRFNDRSAEAPVIHFGGPLRIMLLEPEGFTKSIQAGQTYELVARVGTLGLSNDTAAIIDDTDMFSFVNADHGTAADLEFTDRNGRNQRRRLKLTCD